MLANSPPAISNNTVKERVMRRTNRMQLPSSGWRRSTIRLALTAAALFGLVPVAAALDVTVTRLKSTEGDIVVCLWRSTDEGFPRCAEGRPFKKVTAPASGARVSFPNLPAGQYAVSMFHDPKRTGKPETNLLGIPTSGIGIANNPKMSLTNRPTFEKGKVEIPDVKSIEIEAQYP
ncbi:hypothetical protein XH96_11790 [Bradyrhizobium sp. CCBAU 51765]|nr:hypothetical protein XH96_11790 [Bradyrhizobium sp. CCBAU 51765]